MPPKAGADSTEDEAVLDKSCADCPSYCPPHETAVLLGRDIGVPMCYRYFHLLGVPAFGGDVRQQHYMALRGSRCEHHGDARPDIDPPRVPKVPVYEPQTDFMVRTGQSDSVATCMKCVHFVPGGTTPQGRTKLVTGACAVSGNLLVDSRLADYAKECHRERGWAIPNLTATVDDQSFNSSLEIPMTKLLEEAARVSEISPAQMWLAGSDYDPDLYITDRELTPDDIEYGIKAWRKMSDPEGYGPDTYHPVFDPESFVGEDYEKIPRKGDDEHPESYVDTTGIGYDLTVTWMELDQTPCLVGHAGVGKTEGLRWRAYEMQVPFDRINITDKTDVEDLVGRPDLKATDNGPEMGWIDGRLTKRWGRTGVLCIDEWNCGRDEVDQLLRPLTDNSKQLVIDQHEGERRARGLYTFFGLTMNPAWDPKYIGTNDMSDAAGNRLQMMWIDLPEPEVERLIITQRCEIDGYDIPKHQLDMVMRIAEEIRLQIASGLPISWGIRPQIAVATNLKWFNPEKSYNRAVGDRLEPQTRQTILDIVRRHA
jgi:MoxR-like ATPase